MLDAISTMNNEVEFVAPAHNLLLNMISSVQVSIQAARKKRFTYLDLERSWASNVATRNDTSII
jgi:hypothetical protein